MFTQISHRTPIRTSTEQVWHPAISSTASRLPPMKSAGSHRGVHVLSDGRARVYESWLESKALLVLAARQDVVQIEDQPTAVIYLDEDGIERRHTFDFRLTMKSGERIAIAVKPAIKAEKYDLRAKLCHIADQIDRSFADSVCLVSDHHLDRISVHNATIMKAVCSEPRNAADDALEAFVPSMSNPRSIASIVETTGLGSAAFRSIVRLIAVGRLETVHHERIDYATLVQARGEDE